MFRKIHSNRNPENTLYSEIRKEFAVYFSRAWTRFSTLLLKYPRQVFVLMVLLMLFSMALSFTVFRSRDKKQSPAEALRSAGGPVETGFTEIMNQTAALQQSIQLKKEIEILISKDSLTAADSLRLEKTIDRLHELTINSTHHDTR